MKPLASPAGGEAPLKVEHDPHVDAWDPTKTLADFDALYAQRQQVIESANSSEVADIVTAFDDERIERGLMPLSEMYQSLRELVQQYEDGEELASEDAQKYEEALLELRDLIALLTTYVEDDVSQGNNADLNDSQFIDVRVKGSRKIAKRADDAPPLGGSGQGGKIRKDAFQTQGTAEESAVFDAVAEREELLPYTQVLGDLAYSVGAEQSGELLAAIADIEARATSDSFDAVEREALETQLAEVQLQLLTVCAMRADALNERDPESAQRARNALALIESDFTRRRVAAGTFSLEKLTEASGEFCRAIEAPDVRKMAAEIAEDIESIAADFAPLAEALAKLASLDQKQYQIFIERITDPSRTRPQNLYDGFIWKALKLGTPLKKPKVEALSQKSLDELRDIKSLLSIPKQFIPEWHREAEVLVRAAQVHAQEQERQAQIENQPVLQVPRPKFSAHEHDRYLLTPEAQNEITDLIDISANGGYRDLTGEKLLNDSESEEVVRDITDAIHAKAPNLNLRALEAYAAKLEKPAELPEPIKVAEAQAIDTVAAEVLAPISAPAAPETAPVPPTQNGEGGETLGAPTAAQKMVLEVANDNIEGKGSNRSNLSAERSALAAVKASFAPDIAKRVGEFRQAKGEYFEALDRFAKRGPLTRATDWAFNWATHAKTRKLQEIEALRSVYDEQHGRVVNVRMERARQYFTKAAELKLLNGIVPEKGERSEKSYDVVEKGMQRMRGIEYALNVVLEKAHERSAEHVGLYKSLTPDQQKAVDAVGSYSERLATSYALQQEQTLDQLAGSKEAPLAKATLKRALGGAAVGAVIGGAVAFTGVGMVPAALFGTYRAGRGATGAVGGAIFQRLATSAWTKWITPKAARSADVEAKKMREVFVQDHMLLGQAKAHARAGEDIMVRDAKYKKYAGMAAAALGGYGFSAAYSAAAAETSLAQGASTSLTHSETVDRSPIAGSAEGDQLAHDTVSTSEQKYMYPSDAQLRAMGALDTYRPFAGHAPLRMDGLAEARYEQQFARAPFSAVTETVPEAASHESGVVGLDPDGSFRKYITSSSNFEEARHGGEFAAVSPAGKAVTEAVTTTAAESTATHTVVDGDRTWTLLAEATGSNAEASKITQWLDQLAQTPSGREMLEEMGFEQHGEGISAHRIQEGDQLNLSRIRQLFESSQAFDSIPVGETVPSPAVETVADRVPAALRVGTPAFRAQLALAMNTYFPEASARYEKLLLDSDIAGLLEHTAVTKTGHSVVRGITAATETNHPLYNIHHVVGLPKLRTLVEEALHAKGYQSVNEFPPLANETTRQYLARLDGMSARQTASGALAAAETASAGKPTVSGAAEATTSQPKVSPQTTVTEEAKLPAAQPAEPQPVRLSDRVLSGSELTPLGRSLAETQYDAYNSAILVRTSEQAQAWAKLYIDAFKAQYNDLSYMLDNNHNHIANRIVAERNGQINHLVVTNQYLQQLLNGLREKPGLDENTYRYYTDMLRKMEAGITNENQYRPIRNTFFDRGNFDTRSLAQRMRNPRDGGGVYSSWS
jgi:hypothetical protein